MRQRITHLLITALIVFAVAAPQLKAKETPASVKPSPALEQYVAKPDSSYQWKKRREGSLGSGEFVELTLTSQTWRDVPWKHQLFIYRPSTVDSGAQALLLIAGGTWKPELEQEPADADANLPGEAHIVAALAESLRAPVAVLLQVPEQPLFDGMVEDEIISHTFAQFMKTNDAEWPLLLPMVKSVVRAMDAIEEFAQAEWQIDVERFLLTGASKRGWTTWLTGAVDPRVNAIAPMVIDMLNMKPHMKLQEASFGGYSEQIHDYTEKGLQDHLDSDRGDALRAIVDPYSYRGQLKQPKLIILGTNDRYWPVDALNLYWDDLEGEKYVLYVPNNGHGLRDHMRLVGTVCALHEHITGGKALPKLDWNFEDRGDSLRLELTTDAKPVTVRSWTAESDSRDFRQARWESQSVPANAGEGRRFVIDLKRPADGFAAVFAEAQFNGQPMPFYLSTNLRVVPGVATAGAVDGN
ncbi:MAG TPA: PhoPQ-activated protein PqaA family protein [Lacipirellulaceae bacterium]|nr:PhoPQ-activated protein PqaA family protein [Lacipirellulaceae bacterium]